MDFQVWRSIFNSLSHGGYSDCRKSYGSIKVLSDLRSPQIPSYVTQHFPDWLNQLLDLEHIEYSTKL